MGRAMSEMLIRRRLVANLSAIAQLLGSGVIAAGGLTLVASHRSPALSGELAVFILLFVQWETFGLLLAKVGLDQLVFAAVTANPRLHLRLARTFKLRVLPIASLFGLVCLLWFPPLASLALAGSVALDVYSLAVLAELNARKLHSAAAIGNLLNYPVFLGLLFAAAAVGKPSVLLVAAAFTASSAFRAAFLCWRRRRPAQAEDAEPSSAGVLIAQPIFNHLLFRIDQLILPVATAALGFAAAGAARYLFLAKFPELVAGVISTAGMVVLPDLLLATGQESSVRAQLGTGLRVILLLASLPGLAVCAAIYLAVWGGPERIPFAWGLPFFLQALFILPANLLTYSMVVAGALAALLRNLLTGLLAGSIVLALAALGGQWALLSLVVPVQLAVYVGCGVFLGWGERRALLEAAPNTPAAAPLGSR